MRDNGSAEISAWQNDRTVWAPCTNIDATTNAIVSALNARYSLPNDGIFEYYEPEASSIPEAVQYVIE